MTRTASFLTLVLLVSGLVLWSSAFVALYGLHALGCAYGWTGALGPVSIARGALLIAWAAHLGLTALLVLWTGRRVAEAYGGGQEVGGFLKASTFAIAVIGLVATAWVGLPVLFLELCG